MKFCDGCDRKPHCDNNQKCWKQFIGKVGCTAFSADKKGHSIVRYGMVNHYADTAHCTCGATWKARMEWDLIEPEKKGE